MYEQALSSCPYHQIRLLSNQISLALELGTISISAPVKSFSVIQYFSNNNFNIYASFRLDNAIRQKGLENSTIIFSATVGIIFTF